MNIMLTFVNRAEIAPADLPTVLLFQKQVVDGKERAVIWKVIRNCRYMHFHPLVFATELSVTIGDQYGNFVKLLPASQGGSFAVGAASSGRPQLSPIRHADPVDGVAVRSNLTDGSFNACLFVRGELLAERRSLAPGEAAQFSLDTNLWVASTRRSASDNLVGPPLPGRQRGLREGDPVSDQLLLAATCIPLAGVASANIVMHSSSAGFTFRKESIAAA